MKREDLEKIATDAARKALAEVRKEERKPREWWIDMNRCITGPDVANRTDNGGIHVREVMPDEFVPSVDFIAALEDVLSYMSATETSAILMQKLICLNGYYKQCKRPEVDDVS